MQGAALARHIRLALAVLLFSLLPAGVAAQNANAPVSVQVRIDRFQIRVGDPLSYELVVTAPPGAEVALPEPPSGSFGAWEVRRCEQLPPDETPADGLRSGWRCTLTVWTVGEYELPIQEVRYTAETSSGVLQTQPLLVRVVSVLNETANELKPLKPQLPMNDPSNLLMLIGLTLLGLLLAAAAVLALVYYRRMVPAPAAVGAPVPASDAADAALQELERIARLGLVAEGRIPEHYVLIADTLRGYIRHLFGIPALERTTAEISAALRGGSARSHPDTLVSLLAESDGVKFARYTPSPEQAQQMLERARQAILASRKR